MSDQDKNNDRLADIMKMSSWRPKQRPMPLPEEPASAETSARPAGLTPSAGRTSHSGAGPPSSSPGLRHRRTACAATAVSGSGVSLLPSAGPWPCSTTTAAGAGSGLSSSSAPSPPAAPWRRTTTTATATNDNNNEAAIGMFSSGVSSFPSAASWRLGGTTTDANVNEGRSVIRGYFKPMGHKHLSTDEERAALARAGGFSLNYKGDMRKPRNMQIDPAENCSLFLTNLPPDCTTSQLIAALTELQIPGGKIYATNIIRPQPPVHSEAAANVSFFTPKAAQALLARVERGQMVFGGYRVGGIWDKNAVRPADGLVGDESRVLLLQGPARNLHIPDVEQFIASKGITYQVDSITWRDSDDGTMREVEWRFGSYRMQAQAVKLLFGREKPKVLVVFGKDPCMAE